MRILMVCLGNICRSPLAEGVLKHKIGQAGLPWMVESAGTNSFHVGQSPHPFSCKVAMENGIDITRQVARRFTADDFLKYDIIYAMANEVIEEMKEITGSRYNGNKVKLLMEEAEPGSHKDVPDPWYGNLDGYYPVYAMIENACEAIIQKKIKSPIE